MEIIKVIDVELGTNPKFAFFMNNVPQEIWFDNFEELTQQFYAEIKRWGINGIH